MTSHGLGRQLRTLVCAGLAGGLLVACTPAPEPPAAAVPRVSVLTVGESDAAMLRKLTARVEAAERAELSFRVAGKLQVLAVKEGDTVAAGDLLAELDQLDFRTVLAERRAAYRSASADYGRAQQLIDDGYITRREFDQLRSRFRQAKTGLEQAEADLAYTSLKAPFAGVVARRYVENFEEVSRGQTVFSLRSADQLDVKIDVPESLILMVADADAKVPQDDVLVTASFATQPDVEYPLSFKEIAKTASAQTRTFEVTYLMPRPEEINILPGMTASVSVSMPNRGAGVYLVPQRAIFGDIAMQPQVWMLDEKAMTVSARPVQIGKLRDGRIEVLQGLRPGDVIVTSPANFLLEGQVVEIAPPPAVGAANPESV